MKSKESPMEHLDEMQLQTRNKVGNQCFFIIFYLLMIDLGLKDYGVKWAASPISVLTIMVLCMGYYLARVIWAGAYISQSKKNTTLIVGLFVTMVITIGALLMIIRTNFFKESFKIHYSGVILSCLIIFIFIVIIVIFSKISRVRNNKGNDL